MSKKATLSFGYLSNEIHLNQGSIENRQDVTGQVLGLTARHIDKSGVNPVSLSAGGEVHYQIAVLKIVGRTPESLAATKKALEEMLQTIKELEVTPGGILVAGDS